MSDKRVMIDCRNTPSENNCSLCISGTEQEVMAVAVPHAVHAHGHEDNAELREMIRKALREDKLSVEK